MKFTFDEKKHAYFLDDKPLMGVTTVLGKWDKGGLIQWAANQAVEYVRDKTMGDLEDGELEHKIGDWLTEAKTAHAKKRDKAAEKGTDVHSQIEGFINHAIKKHDGHLVDEEMEEHAEEQLASFMRWSRENSVKFLESEKKLYSEEHWIAGTADFVAEIDGKTYVGDIKTGKSIWSTAFYQCAAYAIMLEDMDYKFDGVVVVHIPAKGELKEYRRYDLDTDKGAFLGILAAYKADKTFKL